MIRVLAALCVLAGLPGLALGQAPPPAYPAGAEPPPPMPPPAPIAPPPPVYLPPTGEPPPQLQPALPLAPPQPPPAFAPGVVHLHITAPEAIVLKRDDGPIAQVFDAAGTRRAVGVVCVAPCDAVVDARAGTTFVFGGGDGTPDSRSFSLLDHQGELQARVSPGSKGMRLGSAIVAGLGGLGVYVGLVTLASTPAGGETPSERDARVGGSTVVTIGGVALMATALVMYLASRTSFELEAGK